MPTHSIHAVRIGTCNLLINMKYTSANEKNVNTNSDLKGGAVGSVRGTASRRRPTGTGSPTGSAAKEPCFRGFEWFVLRLCDSHGGKIFHTRRYHMARSRWAPVLFVYPS